MALPDIPRRRESRLIPSGIEITAGNTVAPPSAVVRASVPDTATCPLADALRNCRDPGVIDAPRLQAVKGPVMLPRKALEAANLAVTVAERPALIADHAVATGQIGQKTFEKCYHRAQ